MNEVMEKEVVVAKIYLEDIKEIEMSYMGDLEKGYRVFFRLLQFFMEKYNMTIQEFEEYMEKFDVAGLEQKYGDIEEMKEIWCARSDIFDMELKDRFLIPFEMFIEGYRDYTLPRYNHCKDCGEEYRIDNPKWFVEHSLHLPKRCEGCRKKRRIIASVKPQEKGQLVMIEDAPHIYNGKTLVPFYLPYIENMESKEIWEKYNQLKKVAE